MGAFKSKNSAAISPEDKQRLLDEKLIKLVKKYPSWEDDYLLFYNIPLDKNEPISSNKLNEIKKLVADGANPGINDGELLIISAKSGCKELVKFFLDKGVKATSQNSKAVTEAIQSYITGRVKSIKATHWRVSALYDEAKQDELSVFNIKSTLERLPSIYYKRSFFVYTALSLKSILTDLENAGADMNADNGAALVMAAKHGEWGVVNLLNNKKADLQVQEGIVLLYAIIDAATGTSEWAMAEKMIDQGIFSRKFNLAALNILINTPNSPSQLIDKFVDLWVQLGVRPEEEKQFSDSNLVDYRLKKSRMKHPATIEKQSEHKSEHKDAKPSVAKHSFLNSNSAMQSPTQSMTLEFIELPQQNSPPRTI